METNPETACPHCNGKIAVREEMHGQAIDCPHCGKPVALAKPGDAQATMSARETYNVVTDLGTGVNVRLRDNLFQLAAILVATVLGALIGMLIADEVAMGAIAGAFIGLLVGLFGSGIFLMIYRFIRHATGHHD
jgi:DNA-directed RNA polymerase subunit RPC12/RpoP/uncharacterized membrane protein YeaQ/YmgE (transglycosylase-associated protein family)